MTRHARLGGAGPRARLPERSGGGTAVAGRGAASSGPDTGPIRQCVGCRERGPRSALVRVVGVDEDGTTCAVVDPGRSMPGRGAWLHADLRCLELAERRRALPRALRTPTLDLSAVRRAFGADHGHPSFTEMGSGLEADGHPMSTRR